MNRAQIPVRAHPAVNGWAREKEDALEVPVSSGCNELYQS
jgi:hypothetical protein